MSKTLHGIIPLQPVKRKFVNSRKETMNCYRLWWIQIQYPIRIKMIWVNTLWKFILLLFAGLIVSSIRSQCVQNNFCHLPGTSGMSSISSTFSRPQQLSCASLCSQSDNCFAVTFDASGNTCELHSDPDGAECFTLREDYGKSLSFREPKGRYCPKVCVIVIHIITAPAVG